MDPISGGVQLVIGLIRTHKLNEWAKLTFTMLWSWWTAFSFACGGALIAHRPPFEAIGTGMTSGACMAFFLFVRSPLTKGMKVAVPTELILDAESGKDTATVEGAGK
jgi:hypothetical protein